jgi:hypothetical protein
MRCLIASPLLSIVALAQTPYCPDKSAVGSLLVDARLAGGGSGVSGLQAKDFSLSGKGLLSPVQWATTDAPLDLVILIEAHERGTALSGAAPLLLTELGPEDRVAVFTYGTGVDQKTGWEQDHGAIGKAIEEGGKGVQLQTVRPLNAVVEGLKMFPDKVEPGRKRVMLLIGDEQDWSTPVRLESVLANLLEKRVTLSVVIDPPRGKIMGKILPKVNVTPGNVGEPRVGETQGRYGSQSVARLAEASGGDAMAPNGVWVLEEMVKRMKERYLLTYCAEKKHVGKVPQVSISEEAKRKSPPMALNVPGSLR